MTAARRACVVGKATRQVVLSGIPLGLIAGGHPARVYLKSPSSSPALSIFEGANRGHKDGHSGHRGGMRRVWAAPIEHNTLRRGIATLSRFNGPIHTEKQ